MNKKADMWKPVFNINTAIALRLHGTRDLKGYDEKRIMTQSRKPVASFNTLGCRLL